MAMLSALLLVFVGASGYVTPGVVAGELEEMRVTPRHVDQGVRRVVIDRSATDANGHNENLAVQLLEGRPKVTSRVRRGHMRGCCLTRSSRWIPTPANALRKPGSLPPVGGDQHPVVVERHLIQARRHLHDLADL